MNKYYMESFRIEMEKDAARLVPKPWLKNLGGVVQRLFVKPAEKEVQRIIPEKAGESVIRATNPSSISQNSDTNKLMNNIIKGKSKKPSFLSRMGTAAKIGIGGTLAAGALGAGGIAYGAMQTPADQPDPYERY